MVLKCVLLFKRVSIKIADSMIQYKKRKLFLGGGGVSYAEEFILPVSIPVINKIFNMIVDVDRHILGIIKTSSLRCQQKYFCG